MSKTPSYCYIVGPSCTGKTHLAIQLAKEIAAPIINCDSIQVYQEVEVGTAKPDADEQREATHHLLSIVEAGRKYSAANYVNDAVAKINQLDPEKAIFCGGSGFYIQALQKGLYPNAETSADVKDQVWKMIEEKGFAGVYQFFQERDPKYAETISPNDHYRLRRGLEILLGQNLTISQLKEKMEKQARSPLPSHRQLKLGLSMDRGLLREKVRQRSEAMLAKGFVAEVVELRKRGLGDWAPLKSVGYKEVGEFLDGDLVESELAERISTATMQLIKKQTTWFRRDPDIHWFDSADWQDAVDEAMTWFADNS